MRINQNINALKAWRSLDNVNTSMGKTLEKLSTGLRINRAGDDAAGLSMSEKMRAQISGLNMAVKNAQDAISLIQTAEGALTETHSILQRMRELAVQSANDTNVDVDRDAIQKEIDQLAAEITRIAETTQFNAIDLLKGSFSAKFHIGANEGQNVELNIANMKASALQIGTEYTATTINGHSVLRDKNGNVKAVWYEGGYFDKNGNLIFGANGQYTINGNTLVYQGEEVAVWKDAQQVIQEGYFDSEGNLITSINGPLTASTVGNNYVLKDSNSNVIATWYDKGYVTTDGTLITRINQTLSIGSEINIGGSTYVAKTYNSDVYKAVSYEVNTFSGVTLVADQYTVVTYSVVNNATGSFFVKGSTTIAQYNSTAKAYLSLSGNTVIYNSALALSTGEVYALEDTDNGSSKTVAISENGGYYGYYDNKNNLVYKGSLSLGSQVYALEDGGKLVGVFQNVSNRNGYYYDGNLVFRTESMYPSSTTVWALKNESDEVSAIWVGNQYISLDGLTTLPSVQIREGGSFSFLEKNGDSFAIWQNVNGANTGYYDTNGNLVYKSDESLNNSIIFALEDTDKGITKTVAVWDNDNNAYYDTSLSTSVYSPGSPITNGEKIYVLELEGDTKIPVWKEANGENPSGYYLEDALIFPSDIEIPEGQELNILLEKGSNNYYASFKELSDDIGYYDNNGEILLKSTNPLDLDEIAVNLEIGSWQVIEATQDAGYYYDDALLWKTDSPFDVDDLNNWKSFEEAGYEVGYYDSEGNLMFATKTVFENDTRITKGIDVSTQEAADAAISKIDSAINFVSNERSNLGAMQNRLEHTIRNLQVSSENLAAAESRIRDADMAKEMMEFTKQQILMQTSNAMLAQSNTIPQNVLRLLQ
ncbi:hypothetical protein X924_00010 [Petrotoga sp. 9PWA.NaAc.5.4]|nr:flagellin [Petrotoga sp. 9PWA.NaAc.5.4]PNR97177.1 hypothetical protein X924_00010 [Petrotoga sp. 9PWA.NaAc.5.4]